MIFWMVIRGVSGIFLGVSLFQAFRSWGQHRTPETGHLEVRTIFPTLLPSPLQQRFHLVFYTDEQLQLIDISSNHNLPSVLFEFMCPAACYHLRPSPCPSLKCVHHSSFLWKPLVGATCRRR